MKKTALVLLLALFAAGAVSAQGKEAKEAKDPARFRPKYRNISFSTQKMSFEGSDFGEASKFGFGFTTGRSYILHKRPIAGMLRLGIDATWFDLNYGNWNGQILDEKYWMHKADIAMGVGFGVHVNPISRLGVHAYFRFNPTFTTMFQNMTAGQLEIDGGYASYFTTGGAISWGVISLGAEARFGGGKYHALKAPSFEEGDGDDDIDLDLGFDKIKHKLKGMRVYVSFRF